MEIKITEKMVIYFLLVTALILQAVALSSRKWSAVKSVPVLDLFSETELGKKDATTGAVIPTTISGDYVDLDVGLNVTCLGKGLCIESAKMNIGPSSKGFMQVFSLLISSLVLLALVVVSPLYFEMPKYAKLFLLFSSFVLSLLAVIRYSSIQSYILSERRGSGSGPRSSYNLVTISSILTAIGFILVFKYDV